MEEKIVVAGFGGQGVLSIGQFIAYSAMEKGLEVTWLPSYGPEMRGGTARCSVVVSDKQVASPIIAVPNTLIAMNKPSLCKFEETVKEGGLIIVNSSIIEDKVTRDDVRVCYLDTIGLAQTVGNIKTANMIALGAYVKLSGIIDYDTVYNTIDKIFATKPKLIPLNKQAFKVGYDRV